ncbi:hypothetical protein PCCS19_09020 [Paenibacillus sp. CCS19]|uniref:metallophosphoesterase family protein n=1 Tax=Paenibacillus sp. CCS19 TaxID=3158387 RepID=UPI00256C2BA2|nr:metallophosphoesterase [Paenibacillus cellulosilyticus]GMK37848.1 hypothetical protein PCCS19_09020 [Paenibacillus cellulosilyticus]
METIKFVHLTDTHMNAPQTDNMFSKFNLAGKVTRLFEHLRDTNVAPAFVIITGDLSHEGNVEDYAYIRQVLDQGSAIIGAPVYVVLGNHDHRTPFREGFLQQEGSVDAYFYSITINGLRLIGLNSQVPGQHHGRIDDQQLAWLEETLSVPAENGTIVALHHPLLSVNGMPDDHVLENRKQLGDALVGTDVVGILAGHVHSNNVGSYHGICSVAATGTAFAGEMADAENFRMYDFCGYNLVSVNQEGISVQSVVLPSTQEEYFRFPVSMLAAETSNH